MNKRIVTKGMRRKRLCFFTVAALLSISVLPVFGAQGGSSVKVTLPDFPTTINGTKVNNDYSKYPLIVYKDITYFPMTYSDCRYLGVETAWNRNNEGLSIEKTDVTAAYQPYNTGAKNSRSYTAAIASFPIQVNGKAIDNRKEDYPLLSFRGITYFPMSWKYSVDEFGWDYSFHGSDGLVIQSANTHLSQIPISADRAKEDEYSKYKGRLSTQVALTDQYVYYEGTKGEIMQAPLSDTGKAKKVYQLEAWSYGDGKTYDPHQLYSENGRAMLFIHYGGATMGGETLLQLHDAGSVTTLNDNRTQQKVFGDKTFEWWVGPMPGAGNLTMKTVGSEAVSIGDPGLIYGWNWHEDSDGSQGGSGNPRAYLAGDDFYILGFDKQAENPAQETTGVYRINLITNETVRIGDQQARDFVVEGDFIYYTDGAAIYKIQISTGKQEIFGPFTMVPYGNLVGLEVLGGHIYYMLEDVKPSQSSPPYDPYRYSVIQLSGDNVKGERFESPDTINLGSEPGMGLMGTTDKYLVCTFEENKSADYGIMVFDKDGKTVFKTSDKGYLRNICIVGDTIYFYNITTGTVCTAKLNAAFRKEGL